MKKVMKKIVSISLFVVMVAALSGCSSNNNTTSEEANTSQANTTSNQEAEESKEAKVEGTITLYTSQPDADVEALIKAFTEKYPDANVEVFRSGTEEVVSKIMAEKEVDSIQADVVLVADIITFEGLKSEDLLMEYKSEELEGIASEFIDKDNMYTGTKIITTAMVVNTDNVKEMPDTWNILTEEAAKANATMPSPLYSGAAAYNLGVITRTEGMGWEFYNELKANEIVVGQGNGGILKAVAAGEMDYGMVVDYIVARAEKEGSPVELIYPKEGVPAITEPVGIMKSTENADVAKAFVDFILSEEGQELESGMGYTPIKDGISAPEGLKSLSDIKILTADTEELADNKEADKLEFSKIFE